jgi:predicted permease
MSWLKGLRARLRSTLARRAAERRMAEEFSHHLDMATAANERAGMPPAEARRQARLTFGGEDRHGEDMRDGRGLRWLDDLMRDTRFALRALAGAPGFTIVAVLSIGLGVGATTSLFSVINSLLLRPLPVMSPERLYSIQEQRTGSVSTGAEGVLIPYERYRGYEAATREVFTGLAAHSFEGMSLRADGPALPAAGVVTTGNFFAVLGIAPAAGAFYTTDDEPAVVLGHRFWQRRFGGAADVIGRTVHVNGQPLTVIGVAAHGFGGTTHAFHVDLWVPHQAYARTGADRTLTPFGRLRPGVDAAAAAAVVSAVAPRIPVDEAGVEVQGARLEPMRGVPAAARMLAFGFLGMLLATALLVLLIAGANIAGMLMARAVARQREMAVRLAMGAGRGRLVRQLLSESLLLFLLGGAAGVVIAVWATRLLSRVRIAEIDQLVIDAAPDLRVLRFALLIAGGAGLLFGLLPALQASRPALALALKDGAGGVSRRLRGRGIFVGAQLAMSVLLLVVGGLLVRTLQHATKVEPGFAVDGVIVASTTLAAGAYDMAGAQLFFASLLDRVRARPEVEAASLAQLVLLSGNSTRYAVRAAPGEPAVGAGHNVVEAAYFETMRIPLLAGRGITDADHDGAARAAVINETLAARLWPGADPLGRRYLRGSDEYEVVGVARDGLYVSVGEEPEPFAFIAAAQHPARQRVLHVRLRPGAGAAAAIAGLRTELAALDPDVALDDAMPLTAMIDRMLLPQRYAALLIGLFGLLGLVLAGIGVYGVLAFHVAQRTRELGIRMALGAARGDVVRIVLGRTAVLAAAGIGMGLLLAAAVTRFLRGLLYGVSPLDPTTFIGVVLLLGAVALVASWLPARRAVRIAPTEALRAG